jgi:hypothetical protein
MSGIANQIRDIQTNRYVEIMLLGDPAKLLLLPLWAHSTIIPDVHQAVYRDHRCNIWSLEYGPSGASPSAGGAGGGSRMFPMDGTVNTGFDYCIIVYDAITRIQSEPLDKWIAIRDQICMRQHPDRKCEMVVIVLKTPRTPLAAYEHISQEAAKLKIHMIPVDNTTEGLTRIKTLVERLAGMVYTKRKTGRMQMIRKLLDQPAL